ncbi:type II inositol 1,4,5-trisphosphate 5-phosphatase-like [Rhagoletis pomonella]|uniref:type II inositol 1,4,5-trisphosphate 5-phosphatase-like n=1 Tax=Rhagoletis pomonella TaxID=28610 RepID=UPI0017834365|nr:type II inositol 1,4,5-trisphosphate 5-phosphatase-like [Rhagoletis pomonella]XP_036318510.1 type II inositol 1,4,5-trisphosphate 5-phosphatase-like [Rhagoletis pomonella]
MNSDSTMTSTSTSTTLSSLNSIPTISAAVSSTGLIGSGAAESDVRDGEKPVNTIEVVQRKFKDNEKVLSIFEAYQIIGQEHRSRLLALVVSVAGGTYAVFSLATARLPPRNVNDLSIDKVFALNESFQFGSDKKGSISQLQFDISTADESAVKYFYYPIISTDGASDFETFHAQVVSAKFSMTHSTMTTDSVLSYSWLNDYRQIGEVKQELKRRENEYIVFKDYIVYCATWNVNNKPYSECPLQLWLSNGDVSADIYAIGLQELDTSAKATAFGENRPDPLWINKMLSSLHKDGEYEELTSVRLVGMMLTIIIRKQLRPYIARCRVKTVARGVFNTLGNKGGVAVSIQLNEGNICFVNSHLAAHMGFVEARNEDYAGIVRGLVFDDELKRTINDHDHIFWVGDLNYRIEEPPGLQLPCNRASPNAYDVLMKYDQLRVEMGKGNCFDGYSEGPIKFRPSYKYDIGTDNFDSSEKQRAPAFCDRVLWKGVRVEQLAYNSIMEIRKSDHKPVYAIFRVKIKNKDEKRYKRIHEEVLKLVDKRENENQPQIMVDKTVIDFGVVRFNELAVCDFTVSNNCPMPVEFMFKVKDPPLNDICEKWLQVEPRAELLMTDSTKRIRVKLLADVRSITGLLKKIRTTNWKFDFDILILHVKNGPDIFLTVTGEYKPSCFGLSVETLCRTERPLSDYTQAQIKELMNDDSPEFRVTMPREFFFLIDYLHKQGDKVEGAFATLEYKHVRSSQFNVIRDWLDTWSAAEFPGTPQAAAEALLMLLDLPEMPLLDPFVEDLLQTNTTAEAMELIALLSSPRRNVFVHLCMFLRQGIEREYYNLQQVASVFGRVLLRSTTHGGRDIYRETRCRDFMHRFVSSDVGGTLSAGVIGVVSGVDGSAGAGSGGGGASGDGNTGDCVNALDST